MISSIKRKQKQKKLRRELRARIRSEAGERLTDETGSKKKQFVYPKARIVFVVFGVMILFLAFSSFASSDPGLLQIGTREILDSFSLSKDGTASKGDLEIKSDVSWQGNFSNDLPEGFEEEIGLQRDASLAVSSDGRTIGFVKSGTAKDVMSSIQGDLEARGWIYVPSGQESAATFVKDEGVFRWLAVTCAEVGDDVSVVLVPAKELNTNQEIQHE